MRAHIQPELLNNSSKASRYKVNAQKSTEFPFASNEQFKNEIKMIPFSIASKSTKYLEIDLTKEV